MKRPIVGWVIVILVVVVSLAYSQTSGRSTEPDSRIYEEHPMANQGISRVMRVTSRQVAETAPGTWSNCLVVNGVAYISGMVARGNDGKGIAGDDYDQPSCFAKIRNLVETAGGTMADVVKITIFVTDITQREKVWRARREVFVLGVS
jgi:2-iminobutanoate/2-iminopropanoate deaminase